MLTISDSISASLVYGVHVPFFNINPGSENMVNTEAASHHAPGFSDHITVLCKMLLNFAQIAFCDTT